MEATLTTETLYNQRLARVEGAMNHTITDRIPVLVMAETWVLAYAGKKIQDIQNDPQKELPCFEKMWNEIPMDVSFTGYFAREPKMYHSLGTEPYFYSKDGTTIQSREFSFMKPEDYPVLINDTKNYFYNKNLLIKYPALNLPYPQDAEALLKSFLEFLPVAQKIMGNPVMAKEKWGMPIIGGSAYVNAFDTLMDFFRGLPQMFSDLRRRPQDVLDACEALLPILIDSLFIMPIPPYPYILMPVHAPTYLTRPQFEKFFWPTFKKAHDEINKRGAKVFMAMEGNWDHVLDHLTDLPKNSIIAQVEATDIFKAKDIIGKDLAIAGGMPFALLKYGTKQECIDHAKKVIDYCAPGGGYMFTTDRVALAGNDFKVENLIAVNEFVQNYK